MKSITFVLLSAACLPLLSAELLPFTVTSMKMEGDYYKGQALKGTDRNLNEKSAVKAERRGWYEIPAFAKHNRAASLSDGNVRTGIRTYSWSRHGKRITVIAELDSISEVETVEVGQSPNESSQMEKIEVYPAVEKVKDSWLWLSPVSAVQTGVKSEKPFFKPVKLGRNAAALKIVISNYRPMSLAVTEIRVLGKKAEGQSALPAASAGRIPADTWRLELESIQGPWKNQNQSAIGNGGIWPGGQQYTFRIRKPGKAEKYHCWLRFRNSQPATVILDGRWKVIPPKGLRWASVGTASSSLFEVTLDCGGNSWADSLLLTADGKFNPNELDAKGLEQLVAEIKPEPEFAERLLKEQPEIEPEEFARKVIEHYGLVYHKPGRAVDENNNILVDGKPFFPILCYGLNPDTPYYRETACNTSHWIWKGWRYSTDKYVVGGRERFAYDRHVRDFLNYNPAATAFIHLYDEPENHPEFTYRKFVLLNALMKGMMPNTATSINFSANSNFRNCFTVSDVLSLDHYPVPGGRIVDIGYSVDYMRYYGQNRPLIFIGQIFKWSGRDKRFPTPNEISAMTMLALVHGVKGMQWWEMTGKNPDLNPARLTRLSPVDYPEEWKRFCQLTKAVAAIQEGLLGPELKNPFTVEKGSSAEFRVIVSADRRKAWLLAVNPDPEKTTVSVDFSKSPIRDLKLIPQTDFGCRMVRPGIRPAFEFEPAGSGVFALESAQLARLERLTHAEFMAKMKDKFLNVKSSQILKLKIQKGELPDWNRGTELLDTWKSSLRPDSVKILLNEAGLHLKANVRYQIGRKSTVTRRDGPVWKDIALELFLGRPGSEDYAHLILNTLNTQADVKVVFRPDGSRIQDAKSVFQWESEASCEQEIAHFRIFIPWKTVKALIGINPGKPFTMNVCSQGRDWCGLTGGGYHVPRKFGRVDISR